MQNDFQSINPYTKEIEFTHTAADAKTVEKQLANAHQAFLEWRNISFEQRASYLANLASLLLDYSEKMGEIATREMGKPQKEGIGEVKKSATLCEFYIKNGAKFLADEHIETEHHKSLVTYAPTGTILGIMPWNYPYWQILRFAIPTLMAGNAVVIKPAPNVFECAKILERLFWEAGFPKGIFQMLYISHDLTNLVLRDKTVQGVSFTGSVSSGSVVAGLAACYAKKSLLELGGSDAFVILEDANLEKAVAALVLSRFKNAGQTCIAAKRLIVQETVAEEVLRLLITKVSQLKLGNPLENGTHIGPMARLDLVKGLDAQVKETVKMGARIVLGGNRVADTNFYEPTILMDVPVGSPAYEAELFGPVLAVFVVENEAEALRLANDTAFGLGGAVWTEDLEKGERFARNIDAGTVAVNGMVSSDPRLPFGGSKESGYGREMSLEGIRAFVNAKVLVVH